MTGSTSLVTTTLTGTFIAGVLLALLRNLKGPLAEHLGTSEGRINRLRVAFTLLLVPMMLVSGLLLDKWGAQPLLILGSLMAGLGISLLDFSRTDRSALPGVLLTGGGTAAVTVASLVLLPRALFPGNAVASANLGCVAFALGMLLTPALMGFLSRRCGFRNGLLLLALACLVPAACGMVVPPSDFEGVQAPGPVRSGLSAVGLWVAAGVLVLYQPVEEALGGLTRGYLKELGVPEHTSVLWLGLLWLAFLGARLLAGVVLRPGYEAWLVLFLIMLAAVSLGNLIGSYRPTGGWLGLVLIGICLAPVFPTVLGLVLRSFPGEQGMACGVLMAGGTVGFLLPSLIHPASERHGPRTAMKLSLSFTLVLVWVALALVLVQ